MKRDHKMQKRSGLLQHESEREKTIQEMKSRLRALVLAAHLGLVNKAFSGGGYMEGLAKAMDRYQDNHPSWKEVDADLSPFEIVLLEYACETGEMRKSPSPSSAQRHQQKPFYGEYDFIRKNG